jgi:hypothetical protein
MRITYEGHDEAIEAKYQEEINKRKKHGKHEKRGK